MNGYIIFTADILEIIATYISDPKTWLNFALSCQKCRNICKKDYLKLMKLPDFVFFYVVLLKFKPSKYKIGRKDDEFVFVPIKYSLRSLCDFLGLDVNEVCKKSDNKIECSQVT